MRRLARRLHRYLLLIVGVQMLLWSVSGLYMVWFDIHYIHGDHFMKSSPALSSLSTVNVGFDEIVARYPDAESIVLGSVGEMPVYRLTLTSKTHLISGLSGDIIQPLSDKQAAAIAMSRSSRSYEVDNVTLLGENEEDSPVGQRGRPLWRVEFKGALAPTFYVSQDTGTVEYIRHAPWQVFDWLWRLHIMDYQDGEDVSNTLLVSMTIIGLLAALAGLLLLPYSFSSSRKAAD
ncbi:MAG: peptidase [Gammaproteobacteria bacterium]|nr:peptidase [Gammaproteobacteria bacterium]